jgi:hypothetical protein
MNILTVTEKKQEWGIRERKMYGPSVMEKRE